MSGSCLPAEDRVESGLRSPGQCLGGYQDHSAHAVPTPPKGVRTGKWLPAAQMRSQRALSVLGSARFHEFRTTPTSVGGHCNRPSGNRVLLGSRQPEPMNRPVFTSDLWLLRQECFSG